MKNFAFLVVLLVFTVVGLADYKQFSGHTRPWLTGDYLPSLSGRVLSVGVGSYTTEYYLLTKNPELFETVDHDMEKALFGSPSGHYTMDFLEFYSPYLYDHVCLYGMLGFPLVTPTSFYSIVDDPSIKMAIKHAHDLLKVGGTLLLGPSWGIVPGQSIDFWINTFTALLSDKYEVIFLGAGPITDNVIWWGIKKSE